ncbi:hypothetical protein [Absidia glauca]|uniref:C3H1-type domain-containing protein n=1 Tax=Absidia glauca TaxID=4829 RepID=A0A163JFU6_ABSGL|nr:hypothetical protein [Absidia glauca]
MLPCVLHFISVLPLFGVTSGIPIPSSLFSNSAPRQVIAQRDLYTGEGTYYEVPGTGSCGQSDTDDESVVAVNRLQMNNGADPNSNPECEKQVEIQGDQGTTTARVVDTCVACLEGDLDMSPKGVKISDKLDKSQQLYKTELCRNWQEMGQCKYGKKCCFAHGVKDLKVAQRHSRCSDPVTPILTWLNLNATIPNNSNLTAPSPPSSSICTIEASSANKSPSSTAPSRFSATTKSPALLPSPSPSTSITTFSSSSASSLSSSPTLSSSALSVPSYHTRSFAEGSTAPAFPLIYRPVTTASLTAPSSWLATTNPGFSSIWLPISHHCSYHQNSSLTTTSDGDRLTGNHASFSDW